MNRSATGEIYLITESEIRNVCGNKTFYQVLLLIAKGPDHPYFKSMTNLMWLLYITSPLQQCCVFYTVYKLYVGFGIKIDTNPEVLQYLEVDLNNVCKDDTDVTYNIFACLCSMFGTEMLKRILDLTCAKLSAKVMSSSNELKLFFQSLINCLNGSSSTIFRGKSRTQETCDYDAMMDFIIGMLVKKTLEDLERNKSRKITLVINDTSPQTDVFYETTAASYAAISPDIAALYEAVALYEKIILAILHESVEVPDALIGEMHLAESKIRHVCGNKAFDQARLLSAKSDGDLYFQSMDNLRRLLYEISPLQQCCYFDNLCKTGIGSDFPIIIQPELLQYLEIDLNNVCKDNTSVIYNIFVCLCSMFGTNMLKQFLNSIRADFFEKATNSSNKLRLFFRSFSNYLDGSCNDTVTMPAAQLKSLKHDEVMDTLNAILVKKILDDLESIGMTKITLVIDDTSPQAVALHKTAALPKSLVRQRVVEVPDALPKSAVRQRVEVPGALPESVPQSPDDFSIE